MYPGPGALLDPRRRRARTGTAWRRSELTAEHLVVALAVFGGHCPWADLARSAGHRILQPRRGRALCQRGEVPTGPGQEAPSAGGGQGGQGRRTC
jgi:hypothetical protein